VYNKICLPSLLPLPNPWKLPLVCALFLHLCSLMYKVYGRGSGDVAAAVSQEVGGKKRNLGIARQAGRKVQSSGYCR
jgi:hypothetical protein